MPQQIFDPPERFVSGTVGPPGQRTFFLQAAGSGRLTSMSLEKQQVEVLADRCNDLLDVHATNPTPSTNRSSVSRRARTTSRCP